MINREIFREFNTDQEASEWGINNFKTWINHIQPDKEIDDENSISNLLYAYAGNMSIPYNQFLRGYSKFSKEEREEYSKNTDIIIKEICKFELQENIIVYRYTHKNLLKCFFESLKPKVGKTFTEKGFMSTTLVPDLLKEFAKKNKYSCLLKLYLPKGTKGAYIRFDKSCLNEHEFLLPPNVTFKIIKKYFSVKYFMIVYECEYLCQ